jgi:hypothetical protein
MGVSENALETATRFSPGLRAFPPDDEVDGADDDDREQDVKDQIHGKLLMTVFVFVSCVRSSLHPGSQAALTVVAVYPY